MHIVWIDYLRKSTPGIYNLTSRLTFKDANNKVQFSSYTSILLF